MSVNQRSQNKVAHAFLSFLCFIRGFIKIHFGLFDFFVFVVSKKFYLSKLMLLDFRCQKISFLCKHSFCIDEKHTQWHWDTKVKVFHEMPRKLYFMKCSERKISQCTLPLKNCNFFPDMSAHCFTSESLTYSKGNIKVNILFHPLIKLKHPL